MMEPKIRYADENNPMGEWMSLEGLAHWLRPLLQLAPADVLTLDAAKQRAELALADARQEITTLRQERDTYRAQADSARQAATEAAQRADAAEARWKAIPWGVMAAVRFDVASTWELMKFCGWYDANRPTAQD